jgi:hypothetical protein
MMDTPESAEPSQPPSSQDPVAPPVAQRGNALPPGFRLGDFEVQDVIGVGGFGIVYRARDVHLRRQVAIKEYMPGFLADRTREFAITVKSESAREAFVSGLRSFVNEARLLAQFEHPALVSVLSYWEDRGTAYMVMPYYSGPTLKRFLQGAPRPSEAWIQTIFDPLLDVLGLLHGARCYHRDVAPDNILMLGKGTPLLLDLGAARQVMGDATQALTAILKPTYAPIEQYSTDGDLRQGPWTDIYACAGVLHWVVSGEPPPTAVRRMLTADLPLLTNLDNGVYSARLLDGIRAGLRLMPADRPQDVEAFRALLFAPNDAVTVATGIARAAAAASANAEASEATILAPATTAPPAPAAAPAAEPDTGAAEPLPAPPGAGVAVPEGKVEVPATEARTRATRASKPRAAKPRPKLGEAAPEAPAATVPAAPPPALTSPALLPPPALTNPVPPPPLASEPALQPQVTVAASSPTTSVAPPLELPPLPTELTAAPADGVAKGASATARATSAASAPRRSKLPLIVGGVLAVAVAVGGYLAVRPADPAAGRSPSGSAVQQAGPTATPPAVRAEPGAPSAAPVAITPPPAAPAAGAPATAEGTAVRAAPVDANGAGEPAREPAAISASPAKAAESPRTAARRRSPKLVGQANEDSSAQAARSAPDKANAKRCAQANLDVAAGMDTPADLQLLRESCGPPASH